MYSQPLPAFEECYPYEIVEWAKALPEPEQCSPRDLAICRLLDDEGVIALGRGLIKRLDAAETREEASQMITHFRELLQGAAQHA